MDTLPQLLVESNNTDDQTKFDILELPAEILAQIFQYLLVDPIVPAENSEATPHGIMLNTALVCKKFSTVALPLLYKNYFVSRVSCRFGHDATIQLTKSSSWYRICCFFLACLNRSEWGLGYPRLFYITTKPDMPAISSKVKKYPNPASKEWDDIITCTMDTQEVFEELAQEDPPLEVQENLHMLMRYSERMDIGSFLVYLRHPYGNILFRCKPMGSYTAETPTSYGKLNVWDDKVFGTCTKCKTRLVKLQVCADCRVSQYCSREMDWDSTHKYVCKQIGFDVPSPPPMEDDPFRLDPFDDLNDMFEHGALL
ncbi:hypothetical protein HK103_001157 [Boothiomyces macroporosus]|uniref:F-box domain-containing protein n=1 Tax=Boothiomyces macroporosus TaxID=261099 RepID=A0AAD5UJZ2_9FUNG|nr:hypothetical protein HK103_001157 [Boothiomyces macroporosus]